MPAKPRALSIVEAFRDRLAAISAAGEPNSYFTEAGATVILGRIDQPNDEDDSIDAQIGVISTDETSDEANVPRLRSAIEIHAIGFRRYSGEGNDSETKAQELISDIKRAGLTYQDRTLGGLVTRISYAQRRISYPEGSSRYVAVDVVFTAEFFETYGDPQA